jgi:uncharacterized membrane protein YphA (DoxX/SURF4 family)
MFSTFPDGLPGTGLALLRVACGALLTLQGVAYLLDWSGQRFVILILALLAFGSGLLLLIGCLTRLAAFVAAGVCISGIFSRIPPPNLDILTSWLPSLLVAVIAAAVICLGPGAFSLDAFLFGRREVEIPKNPRPSL